MKFRYSIARYMPSLVRGECLNVGVLVEDSEGIIYSRFLTAFDRVRAVYPDADRELLKIGTSYLARTFPKPEPQGRLQVAEGRHTLDRLVRDNQAPSLSLARA